MILNKYSRSKDGTTLGHTSAASSHSSGGGSSPSHGNDMERYIWGQDDDGSDVDGDLVCGGNMYVMTGTSDENDDDASPTHPEPPTENFKDQGNLYVEKDIMAGGSLTADGSLDVGGNADVSGNVGVKGKVEAGGDVSSKGNVTATGNISGKDITATGKMSANSVEAPEAYGKSLFLDYEGKKTNVLDLFEKFKADIIEELSGMMPEIPEPEENYGSRGEPVILLAGRIRRTSGSATVWTFYGNYSPFIANVGVYVDGGLMTVKMDSAAKFITTPVVAVNATVSYTGDTEDLSKTAFTNDGVGAHWLEARVTGSDNHPVINIREFHLANSANNAWSTNAWNDIHGPFEINIVVYGYGIPASS